LNFESPKELVSFAIQVGGGATTAPNPVDLRTFQRELGKHAHGPGEDLLAALDEALTHPQATTALAQLHAWGLIRLWLPEVAAMDKLHEGAERQHKDLWAHTLQVVEQAPAEADLRWVALCHDIGKPATRAFGPEGVSFWRHEGVGAWLFRGIGARLAMPPERIARIAFVIEHHARTNQYEDSWSDKAVRRLRRESGPFLDDMLAFSRADWSTRRLGRVQAIHAGLDRLAHRLETTAAADNARAILPQGLADAILAASGRPAGPWLGELLEQLTEELRLPDGDTTQPPSIDVILPLALARMAETSP